MPNVSLDAVGLLVDDLFYLRDRVLNRRHAMVHNLQRLLHEFHRTHRLSVVCDRRTALGVAHARQKLVVATRQRILFGEWCCRAQVSALLLVPLRVEVVSLGAVIRLICHVLTLGPRS